MTVVNLKVLMVIWMTRFQTLYVYYRLVKFAKISWKHYRHFRQIETLKFSIEPNSRIAINHYKFVASFCSGINFTKLFPVSSVGCRIYWYSLLFDKSVVKAMFLLKLLRSWFHETFFSEGPALESKPVMWELFSRVWKRQFTVTNF